jgi:hypothetical protein
MIYDIQVMMNLIILLLCRKILQNIWHNRLTMIIIDLEQT